MGAERKFFSGIELKAEKAGSFTARIATLNVIDKDGDVTLAGAFPQGKDILISSYMHGSWSGGLPVGKGSIRESGDEVLVDGMFNLSTETGKEHYETLKFSPELSEWSYGFRVLAVDEESEWNENPKVWRVLKELDVFEASPVLRGAGENTGLLSIKSDKGLTFVEQSEAALAAVDELLARAKSLADLRREEGRSLSDKSRQKLDGLVVKLGELSEGLKGLSRKQEAISADDQAAGLYLRFLRTKNELRGVL